MGFADKLKDFTKQAQDAVAEHSDQLHDAVDAVGDAADRKTHRKHSAKIAKVGQKAGQAIDRFGSGGTQRGGETKPQG